MPISTIDTSSISGLGYGFKNRIINGGMVIDQRNAGASVTPATSQTYTLDRWNVGLTQASKFSVQQNAGSVTPPTGFTNYLGCTSTSAYSVASGDTFFVEQRIEGFNTADLMFGTANAATVTISFWVRSSLTGTFGGVLGNSGSDYRYPFTYTISSANTWEQKTITISGATAGTWVGATNGRGMRVIFNLGSGTTYSGTANSWGSGEAYAPTGAVSVVGTNGATFYITGVQLEKGTVATSFDWRPYGTELALCQRYAIAYGRSAIYETYGYGFANTTSSVNTLLVLPVQMRVTPSVSVSGTIQISDGASGSVIFVLSLLSTQSSPQQVTLNATSSGLTQHRPYRLENNNNTTSLLVLSAEL